jgi:carbon monoxide dehydrogenase subunit G
MRLEQSFTVPVPLDRAWAVLLDLERVAPCMPGATLTEFDGERFAGNVRVKLGPVNLTYNGHGHFVERDEQAGRVVIEASGRDRTSGTAAVKVTSSLRADEAGTRVDVVSDLHITGRAAQFGRGMLADVSGRLLGQFADCLAGRLAEESAPAAVTAAAPSVEAPAAAAPSVEAPATTEEPAVAAVQAPARPAAQARAEPIDLLAVTGVGPAVRRALPYVLTFVAGAAVMWIVLRVLR